MSFVVTHTQAFNTAEENMRFDDTLLQQLQTRQLSEFFRYYTWKNPGITYPKSIPLHSELNTVDSAVRSTGGGIVFHCPGDSVFSMGFLLNDPRFPIRFKDKLQVISEWFGIQLEQEGYITHCVPVSTSIPNRLFCNAYPNPFERYWNSQKAVAFAMKRERDIFIIQGIIHRASTHYFFSNLSDSFSDFFTSGLSK